MVLRTGGGGSNTSVGFARMGFNAATISETGKDPWADIILAELHKEFVGTSFVVREKQEQTGGSVILVSQDGGRTVLVHRGAASQLDPHDIPEKHLPYTEWIHLSSIAGRQATLEKIFSIVSQSKRPRLSWNPGAQELKLLAEGRLAVGSLPVEILFVNEEEWGQLDSIQQQLTKQINHVVITNGSKGGRVFWNNDWHEFTTNQVAALDDTGAGDSFAVGYVSAVLYDKDLDTAVAWGKQNAASVVQHVGAKPGLITKSQVQTP